MNYETNEELSWQRIVMKYTRPELFRSIWQICNSLLPYLLLWYLMYRSLEYSYWITLLLTIPACGFLIRLFIIFHDCGHGSYFRSKRANEIIGTITGLLAFTPYNAWSYQHHIHHSTSGNLDKRGIGDVWTMTVEEYQDSSKGLRFFYKAFRNPFFMFTVGPLFVVFITNRFTKKSMTKTEKKSIWLTNLALLLIAAVLSYFMGLKAYLLIQLPVILISHSMGLWLFYVQHQYDEASWERTGNWDYKSAAIKGSSFLKLNPVLQWFTGNIGFHHVHHLSSKIPNYNLPRCHAENDLFKEVKPLRFSDTFKAMKLNLWDEANRRLISFRDMDRSFQSYLQKL